MSTKRGRIPTVETNLIDEEILNYKCQILQNLKTNEANGKYVFSKKLQIWQEIADGINNKYDSNITSESIRIRVALNRSNISEKLGLIKDACIESNHKNVLNNDCNESYDNESSNSEDREYQDENNLIFEITLSVDEWNVIQPREKIIIEKRGPRIYRNMLTPFEWSNIIHEHFFLHTRLPCCLVFKKANVSLFGVVFISLRGKCSTCGSIFEGTINEIPTKDTRVVMKCSYEGNFNIPHSKKRRIIGSVKERSLAAIMGSGICPSVYIRNEANRIMEEGDPEPAHIPKSSNLRAVKSKVTSLARLHPDPILSLGLMKNNQIYGSTIRDIGFDKFFVHLWSHLQLQIYKDNYEKTEVPTIFFDATGGCCHKIKRKYNKTCSSPIFLYEGVMNINNQSFTVLSMLSEQHDSTSIYMWLKRWLRCGVKPPKLVISDQSLALMSALVNAFTQYQSLEEYLDLCFSIVVKNKDIPMPLCMIKNDINHFMHLVTQWSPLKNTKFTRTKQLIARTMGLLVYSNSINQAENILKSLFTIILSKYDGKVLHSSRCESLIDTPCASSKKYLQSMITSTEIDFVDINFTDNTNNENEEVPVEYDNLTSSFKEWAQSIADNVKTTVNSIEGEYDNAQYLPELEPIIVKTMKLFPCWSGIMGEKFGYGNETSSSARIECNFNHIKNRVFKNEQLPLRVDTFVEKLMLYYRGDHLLVQGSVSTENSFNIGTPSSRRSELLVVDQDEYNVCDIENQGNDNNESIISLKMNNEDKNVRETSLEKNNYSLVQSPCIPCNNGDFPKGLHKCLKCKKSVHLQGCSVSAPNAEEGCGEARICLSCDKNIEIEAECSATENWGKKGRTNYDTTKSIRSTNSYLVHQPGFELIDLNLKKSIIPVILLKNGNSLMHKPFSLPGVGKIVLNNTCSVDSILSILASSAADSCEFREYMNNIKNSNITADIALDLITEKQGVKIYNKRIKLMLQHFEKRMTLLVGGLKLIDTIDTVASMANKIMKNMPSFIRTSQCGNDFCSVQLSESMSTMLSLNVYNENILIQNEVQEYLGSSTELCVYCGQQRHVVTKPTTHILIELNSIPTDLEASTSIVDVDGTESQLIRQNFVKPNYVKVQDITKIITNDTKVFKLRGAIIFHGGQRRGLRESNGHYTACVLRSNDKWEVYDDTKQKVQNMRASHKYDVELLIYTL